MQEQGSRILVLRKLQDLTNVGVVMCAPKGFGGGGGRQKGVR